MDFEITDEQLFENFRCFCQEKPKRTDNLLFHIRKDSKEIFLLSKEKLLSDLAQALKIEEFPGEEPVELDVLANALILCAKTLNLKEGINESRRQMASALRREILKILWPRLVRRALQVLRDLEDQDENNEEPKTYRFDIGIEKLDRYFKTFVEYEDLLFGAHEFQRDHTLHVFRVFLIGITLLFYPPQEVTLRIKEIDCFTSYLNQKKVIPNELARKIAAMWTLAAICHDLGYPLETIEKINNKVVEMLDYFGLSTFSPLKYTFPPAGNFNFDLLLKWISMKVSPINEPKKYAIEPDSLTTAIAAAALDKLDHGLISAGILLKNLAYFQEGDISTTNRKIGEMYHIATRSSILKAIALHNLTGTLFFEWDLSMILFLCDELQDWDRPTSKERKELPVETRIFFDKLSYKKVRVNICRTPIVGNNLSYTRRKFKRFIEVFRNTTFNERQYNVDIYVSN